MPFKHILALSPRQRLAKGHCPLHARALQQELGGFDERVGGGPLDGDEVTIVSCPEPGCRVQAYARFADGPFEILPEFESLLDDAGPAGA